MPGIPGAVSLGRSTRIEAEAKGEIAMRNRVLAVDCLLHEQARIREPTVVEALQAEDTQPKKARSAFGFRGGERGAHWSSVTRAAAPAGGRARRRPYSMSAS